MSAAIETDIGPLIWVKGEIDLSLSRSEEALTRYLESPGEGAQLKIAQSHLHQARGALALVGLDGVTHFTEALELLLSDIEQGRLAAAHSTLDLAHNAMGALRHHLDELVAGAPDQPLKLWPLYQKLQASRSQPASAADLFFPDLSVRPLKASTPQAQSDEALARARARFERGLLQWLRKPETGAGLDQMGEALAEVERQASSSAGRAFWWAAQAMLDAQSSGGIAADLDMRRLWGRVGNQIRRNSAGAKAVSERLLREVLYHVAIAPAATERIGQVKAAWQLDALLPQAGPSVDISPLKPVLRGLRDTLANAKDAWNRFCAGAAVGLPQFAEAVDSVAARTQGLPEASVTALAAGLREAAQWLRRNPLQHNEAVAMEVATALLLLEIAAESFGELEPDYPRQAALMTERLAMLPRGETPPPLDQPLLGEMSRRAQEKLFMSQVAREILNNLAVIEQTLDGYFRDPARRDELESLAKPIKQVQGALSILAQDDAVQLLGECQARVAEFARAQNPPEQSAFEDVAHKLSVLGFFVEALQHGPADLQRILNPETAGESEAAATVEQQLADRRGEAQALAEALKAHPEDSGLRQELQANLETIREEAALVDDARLERQARDALQALQSAAPAEAAAQLDEAVAEIAPAPAVPVPPALPQQQSQEEVDSELLAIFLEEAREVLSTIGEHLALSRDEPHNHDVLTTIRRGFHTLKGSGRMVGLRELGEVAWAVEQVMNRWLQQERDATAALHDLVERAHALFGAWVAQLESGGGTRRDDEGVVALAEALREDRAILAGTAAEAAEAEETLPESVELIELTELLPEEEMPAAPAEEAGFALAERVDGPAQEAPIEAEALEEIEEAGEAILLGPLSPEPRIEDAPAEDVPRAVIEGTQDAAAAEAPIEAQALEEIDEGEQILLEPLAPLQALEDLQPPAGEALIEAEALAASEADALAASEADALEGFEASQPEPLEEIEASQAAPLDEAGASRTQAGQIAPPPLEEPAVEALEPVAAEAAGEEAAEAPEASELAAAEAPGAVRPRLELVVSPREAEEVRIGELVLSLSIYSLYLEEARQHLGVLRRELARLHLNPNVLPEEATVRAAHTLGGISGTVGFMALHDLGRALEHAMNRIAARALPVETEESELLNRAASTLEGMLAAIADRREPLPAGELAAQLDALAPGARFAVPPGHPLDLDLDLELELAAGERAEPLEEFAEPAGAAEEADAAGFEPGIELVEAQSGAPQVLEELAEEAPSGETLAEPASTDIGISPAAAPAAGEESHEEKRKLRLHDEIDESLLPVFLEEAQDLMREIQAALHGWRGAPGDEDVARSLKRLLHTLKGSARMAGAMGLGELVHAVETRVEQAVAEHAVGAQFLDELDHAIDRCATLVDRLRGVGQEWIEPVPEAQPEAAVAAPQPAPQTEPARAHAEPESAQLLRVRADLMDRFVNEAGEMAIARSRIEGEMRVMRNSLLDLTENVIRLRGQLRELEIQAESQMQARAREAEQRHAQFDPLEFDRFTRVQELTRSIAESVNDVSTVQHNLLRNLDGADAALTSQGRLNRELQQALMSVRMVPFNSAAERLHRIVRQTAKELGRKATLDIRGGQIELDRGVLDKMVGPLEHLLRNAVSHGLESTPERVEAGKPEIGQINVSLAQEGNEIALELADDGRGLDLEAIRRKAADAGLIAADTPMSETDLAELIFRPGFSTAKEVSAISGRGVGMDVVKSAAVALGGRVDVASEPGRGARFRIWLPQTLALLQALLVRVAGKTYAVPASMVEQVMEVKSDGIERMQADGEVQWLGQRYPYRYLPRLLGDDQTLPVQGRYHWVLLVRAGSQRVAVHVDEMRGNHEVVVKKTGPQLSRIVGVAGATVLGDGEIVLIINPVAMAAREARRADAAATLTAAPAGKAAERYDARRTVMVVDDSLTVRKITGRLLEREGYRVLTAKDGVDALEQLLEAVPDVMLVDIEMPRMDGFDLTRNVRADERLKHVPIIMITSRIAEKHRNFAHDIGVNNYLGKPYNEEELLGLIAGYVAQPA